MSRAFVKDGDDAPEVRANVERTEPYPLTAAGRTKLERAVAEASDPAQRAKLERALELAVVPAPPSDRDTIDFGARVTVDGVGMPQRKFTIVGDDEADIPAGMVGASSPLAQALLGRRVGGRALWSRPVGDVTLRIRAVEYPESKR
jgi:transcription elongation GreA/GreB family factor